MQRGQKQRLRGEHDRSFLAHLLITAFALASVNMAQAQMITPATPANIRTAYTGDVINGKKVVKSLNTNDLER